MLITQLARSAFAGTLSVNRRATGLIVIATSLLLSACGGGSGSGGDSSVIPQFEGSLTYIDRRVSFAYPEDWILEEGGNNLIATVTSNVPNRSGGRNNCAYNRQTATRGDFFSLTEILTDIFSDDPEPEVDFITVHGNQAARVTGFVPSQGFLVPSIGQSVFVHPVGHLMLCAGTGNDAEFAQILDSFNVR